ncbi:MAG: sigma-70 family RNA polymerase sigma factor [Crocinitomicaceae bacterium]|nr:sigma-70 family RNA polymerase sigma factor [Crocinitomicaceae bacterium]MDB4075317.1 sigma-70 family RNA polymerase sigma factor [Crocinitomicaceae bacterium]MDC0098648.1 sigma-70 family RNA polymerase sigma factor [Crocinitomicaceae bacterium]MDC1385440.1 sigma-70 family RNA polymerase sigma factor [Crocinitomicaceae bacterium]|tara:strand:- start:9049 stop:9624 length:576 start_codon:yes stop_codon:yes gene_type:complete
MLFSRKNKYKTLSDDELLRTYKEKQSSEVIGEYFQRYGHLVMGTSMKYLKNKFDAEDLAMHLFEKLPGKLLSHNISNFKSWLYMVTKNECLMILRKKGNLTSSLTRELEDTDDVDLKIEKEEQLEMLEDAIEDLKEEQKECIKLFYIESKSYQEITEMLRLDIKKVKSAIQNGKRNLKLNLEGRNEFKSII